MRVSIIKISPFIQDNQASPLSYMGWRADMAKRVGVRFEDIFEWF